MTPAPGREGPASDGEPTDGDLVAAARRGDRRALEALLRRHHDRVHLVCRRMCADRGDAEDATQEALISIVRGLPRYDGRAAFTTWAHRVAVNASLDQLRRRSRAALPVDPVGDGPAAPDDAELAALASEVRGDLDLALAALPAEFRVPVVLRDLLDLDYAEIAEVLELPPGTVRSRISRGRARLAALLPHLAPTQRNQAPDDDVEAVEGR